MGEMLPVVQVSLLGLILLSLWLVLYQIVRQQGRLLLRLDNVEHYLKHAGIAEPQEAGLAIGTSVAAFSLPDLSGHIVSLNEFQGKRVFFVNWSPQCGYCDQIAPDLARLQSNFQERNIHLLLVSRGSVESNRHLAAQHGLNCPILLLNNQSVTIDAFKGIGTPAAYLLDEKGQIARPLAIGAEQVPTLALELTNGDPKRLPGQQDLSRSRIERNGLKPGTLAPKFSLPSLAGGNVALEDFRGKKVLLVFSDPQCGPCDRLAPELVRIQKEFNERGDAIVMISRGEATKNRQKIETWGLRFPVALQQRWEISRQYGIFATPVAFLVDETGVIMRDVAKGFEEIVALAHEG